MILSIAILRAQSHPAVTFNHSVDDEVGLTVAVGDGIGVDTKVVDGVEVNVGVGDSDTAEIV